MKNKNNKLDLSIWSYLKKKKAYVFFYILVVFIGGVGEIFFAINFAKMVEYISLLQYENAKNSLLLVILTITIQRICWYFGNLIYYKGCQKIRAELSVDLAKQAFKLNSKTYADHDSGTFVKRIVDDPEKILDGIATLIDRIVALLSAIVMFTYIATLNVYITIALASLVVSASILETYRAKKRVKMRKEVRAQGDKVNSLTTEIVKSEKDIKSLGLENKLAEVSKNTYESYQKSVYNCDMKDCNMWSLRNFIISVGSLFVLLLGVLLMERALLTLSAFMIVYANRDSLWEMVWNIGNLTNTFTEINVSHKRMFALFDEDEFVTEKFGKTSVDEVKGNIEFKGVSYTFKEYEYPDETKNDDLKKKRKRRKNKQPKRKLISENKIFENLSFKIKSNTTVAFVGKSGSGKSTILNLMAKMYVAEEGEVLIDGININDFDKPSLRKAISLVNQFPYIFDMSIKQNLMLTKADATDEEIMEAIKKASLKEFIDSLPKGINTKVGESGIKLSGGQRQRLAIARALLRDSAIIIFDESTSSLDNFAQEDIKKSIDGLKGKSTIVIVAHRLSTIKNVDNIYFLDHGKIVDQGTFDELYKRNETFKTMFMAENI